MVKKYTDKVDNFTLYEFMTGAIDEEKFNEALTQQSVKKSAPYKQRVNEIVDTT